MSELMPDLLETKKNNLVEKEEEKAGVLAHKVISWRRSMPVPIYKPSNAR